MTSNGFKAIHGLAALLMACVPIEDSSLSAEPAPAPAPPPPQQRPANTVETSVTLGDEPALGMPVGHVVLAPDRGLPVIVERTKLARLRLVGIGVDEVASVTPLLGVHPAGTDPLEKHAALRRRAKALPLADGGGDATEVDVFARAKSELVLAVLEAPGAMPRAALAQRGELSVLLKLGIGGGLVWVTSTRTGKPVAGAEIAIRQGHGLRLQARTDSEGIARLPAEKLLRTAYGAGRNADAAAPILAVARSGSSIAIASERWSSGIDAWQLGLPLQYSAGEDALRGTVAAERGIYRPGDTVHLLGVLRRRLLTGKLAAPAGSVKVSVTDPDGAPAFSDSVALTPFGTFRAELRLPATARLGRYVIAVDKDSASLRERFEVGEYRAVRFEVGLPKAGEIDRSKESFELPISAHYLYGAPVSGGHVSYTISARPKHSFGEQAQGFDFVADQQRGEVLQLADGEGELDEAGRFSILAARSIFDGSYDASQALDVVVEASVRDAAGEVVSGHSVQSLLRESALVGVRSDSWVVSPSQGWTVKVVAASAGGEPLAGKQVAVRLVRRKWMAAAERQAGEARFSGDWQDDVVETKTVTSTAAPLDVHFALPAGGEYRVEAGLDGSATHATETVWAYGSDAYGAWDNEPRMQIHADKTSYQPGERAKLYAEVPYQAARALVTVERAGVLEAKTLRLEGAGTPIEIDVTEAQVPNVFASVAVVPEGLGSGVPAAGPALRVGYQELQVSPARRRLKVEVLPATTRARPGESVEVVVKVTDAAGRPARSEVTLWAADEGVLQLTGYATPDPFVPVYARHSLGVRTSASLLRLVSGVSDAWDEYGGDSADGEDPKAAMRSRFLGTAFFSRGVVTDAKGRAKLTIPLPDNLTRWRVMAATADTGERFGSGEASIEAAKPLQVMPAFPRFLTRGDRLDATVMVHNQTGSKGDVEVGFEASGVEVSGSPTQTVTLDAGEQAPVRFAISATAIGAARLRARAKLGNESDAFEITLPVNAPTLWHTELVGEGRLDQDRKLSITLPATADPALAELTVSAAPGVLSQVTGAVEALLEYPHGCVEQTTSRLIPMVLLEDLLKSSGDARLSGREHRARMEQSVAHVLEHQNGDGGFGLWPSSDSEGFLTAYALWGLLTARDHGYPVPSGAVRRGFQYLHQHATEGDDMHGQFASRDTAPFSAFVFASARQDDTGLSGKLAANHAGLSRFGTGLLGAALVKRERPESKQLLAELERARRAGPNGGALIADGAATDDLQTFGYGRDLRATAVAVRALVESGKLAAADDLIAGILGERAKDGSWGTTYNNLWALHALSDYVHAVREPSGGRVKVALGSGTPKTLDLDTKSPLRSVVLPAAELPAPGQAAMLSVSAAAGSSLRYTARLRYALTTAAQEPADHGFAVSRELFDAKSGEPVTTPSQGQLLRVRVTLRTGEDRAQVALIDRLPAGLEAVDTALATSAGASADPGADSNAGPWVWRELHDERVTCFADTLPAGTHSAEYLARALRTGTFVRPAPSAEAMYSPDVFGHGSVETLTVVAP